MKMTKMLKRKEREDEKEAGDADDVLRASGADTDDIDKKDGTYVDENGEAGEAGGVLRASGADAGGIEKMMIKMTMKERRITMKADAVWVGEGENRVQSRR
jgi:hypothetical protein